MMTAWICWCWPLGYWMPCSDVWLAMAMAEQPFFAAAFDMLDRTVAYVAF